MTDFAYIPRFRFTMPAGNTKPLKSSAFRSIIATRKFVGDHLEVIGEGDQMRKAENQINAICALGVSHLNHVERLPSDISASEIHCPIGGDAQVGHPDFLRVRFDTRTIAEGAAVPSIVVPGHENGGSGGQAQ